MVAEQESRPNDVHQKVPDPNLHSAFLALVVFFGFRVSRSIARASKNKTLVAQNNMFILMIIKINHVNNDDTKTHTMLSCYPLLRLDKEPQKLSGRSRCIASASNPFLAFVCLLIFSCLLVFHPGLCSLFLAFCPSKFCFVCIPRLWRFRCPFVSSAPFL